MNFMAVNNEAPWLFGDGLNLHRDSVEVANRWAAVWNAGGRTTGDFAAVNPSLDSIISRNALYLSVTDDQELSELQDRLIRARDTERSAAAQAAIGAAGQFREDASGIYGDVKAGLDRHLPSGEDLAEAGLGLGLVVVGLAVLALVLR